MKLKQFEVLAGAQLFPKTFSRMLESDVLNTYSNDLHKWAQGLRGYPSKLEKIKLYGSQTLKSKVIVGVDEAKKCIQEKLNAYTGEEKLKILTMLTTESFEKILTIALQEELIQVNKPTKFPFPNRSSNLQQYILLHSFRSDADSLKMLTRNIVRLNILMSFSVGSRTQDKLETLIGQLGANDATSVCQEVVNDYFELLPSNSSLPYDTNLILSKILRILIKHDPVKFLDLVTKFSERFKVTEYREGIESIVSNIVNTCIWVDSSDKNVKTKVEVFKQLITNFIDNGIPLRIIERVLESLVNSAIMFFRAGLENELLEIGQLYVTVASVKRTS